MPGRLAMLALVPLVVLLTGAAPATTDAEGTAGLRYVALGDSFAAGYGLEPVTGEPVPGCAQAEADYPHRVAAALDLDLVDVSCSGAKTADVVDTRQETPDGTAPVQLDALTADTDVVTLTIGGNDAGFTPVAESCLALSATGPVAGLDGAFTAPDCASLYTADGVDSRTALLDTTVLPALVATLDAIRDRAPGARVFVVGYPALLPPPDEATTGCFSPAVTADGVPSGAAAVPFTDVDVVDLARFERALDDTVRAAAATRPEVEVVDVFAASAGHDLCSTDPWVAGVTLVGSSLADASLAPGGLHPNEAGVAALADETTAAIRAAFAAPSASATPPAEAPGATTDREAAAAALPIVTGAALVLGVGAVVLVVALRRRSRSR